MKISVVGVLGYLLFISFSAHASTFPSAPERRALVEKMGSEMVRLDGEALFVRQSRKRSFASVVHQIGNEAAAASTWPELARSFKRLNQSYPNLHSRFQGGDWFQEQQRAKLAVHFAAEWISPKLTIFRVSKVQEKFFARSELPRPGDVLLAINGRPMSSWSAEHFEFCKWPLREQCDLELENDFTREVMSWTRSEPVHFTLRRGDRRWTVNIPLLPPTKDGPAANDLCANDKDLYPGFELQHAGRFACLFTKEGDSSLAILRISSFYYSDSQIAAIRSVREEVDALWPWWQTNAGLIKELIIDVAGNHGGNAPLPYYEILFQHPYQEQRVRFRKIPELADDLLRRNLFWEENGQEIWFQNLLREGIWDSTAARDFLPSVPMFCASPGKDCRDGLFPVRGRGFLGHITLLTNYYCVSACDGFMYTVKKELKDRVSVAGQPHAADSAYSRLTITMLGNAESGFFTKVAPIHDESSQKALFSQTVVVSRSVDDKDQVVSGLPLAVEQFIPRYYDQDDAAWRAGAVKSIIEGLAI